MSEDEHPRMSYVDLEHHQFLTSNADATDPYYTDIDGGLKRNVRVVSSTSDEYVVAAKAGAQQRGGDGEKQGSDTPSRRGRGSGSRETPTIAVDDEGRTSRAEGTNEKPGSAYSQLDWTRIEALRAATEQMTQVSGALHGFAWLCMALHGFAWLCMATTCSPESQPFACV